VHVQVGNLELKWTQVLPVELETRCMQTIGLTSEIAMWGAGTFDVNVIRRHEQCSETRHRLKVRRGIDA
jgi:hypothetical protein